MGDFDNIDDNLDDFDSFMDDATTTNNSNNNNNKKMSGTAPPPMDINNNNGHQNKLPIKTESKMEETIKMEETMQMSQEYINGQFNDWRSEFKYMMTQKTDELRSELINDCIHSILCRWTFPQNACDKKHSVKEIAENIIQIMINEDFNQIFPFGDDCFSANNSSRYLPRLHELCDIFAKLNKSRNNSKTLSNEIKKRCKKILHKEMFESLQFGPKIYFCAGLLSVLSNSDKKEGFFWRTIISMMDKYELAECAELFAIMFECYPEQITAHKNAFVQNCFKYIFVGHSISVCKANDNNNDKIKKIKSGYMRLMNVVNGKWKHISNLTKDKLIQDQLNKTIEKNASNAEINGDCFAGITLICGCDIIYATNHFLPKILYPIIRKQFEHQKPVIQVFLLELYYQCCVKILKRHQKCQSEQGVLIQTNIISIMSTLLALSISSSSNSINIIDSTVTICCIYHLFIMEKHIYIQNIIQSNTYSPQQLLQFTTNILQSWTLKIKKLGNAEKVSQQDHFQGFINVIAKIFKEKSYNDLAFKSIKQQYQQKNKKK